MSSNDQRHHSPKLLMVRL